MGGENLTILLLFNMLTFLQVPLVARVGPPQPRKSALVRALVTRVPLLGKGVRLPYVAATVAPVVLGDVTLAGVAGAFMLFAEAADAPTPIGAAAGTVVALGARLLAARVFGNEALLPHLAPLFAFIAFTIVAAVVDPDTELGVALHGGPDDVSKALRERREKEARDDIREHLFGKVAGLDDAKQGVDDDNAMSDFDRRLR